MDRSTSHQGKMLASKSTSSPDEHRDNNVNVECAADNVELQCVRQQPMFNTRLMCLIHLLNLDIDPEDETLSNVASLLSSSFPSNVEENNLKDNEFPPSVFTSTPDVNSKKDCLAFAEFRDASPILFTSRNRQPFMMRRCRLVFDSDDKDTTF